ncbi:hypothetical protein COJ27_29880 [Bacillus cereus]|uniref:class I SAM-dependent methyltransferase n=1 Tax=Bacillus cereus TaxID=1396 RepID=UPI000BF4AFF5|nr:class I SAM-dependent methyltransferase [Bacillus cereus]PFL57213.1 hypothetical protein COJ27_29880 [Bacillus cereus]
MEELHYNKSLAKNYWDKRIKESADLKAVLSYGMPDFINEAYNKWEQTAILNLLDSVDKKCVLDVGCGIGRYVVPLVKRGAYVTAVDISTNMLERCKERCIEANIDISKVDFLNNSADELSFNGLNFDIVLCTGVFEHLHEEIILNSFRQQLELLVDGGLHIMVVNNSKNSYLKHSKDNQFRKNQQLENGYYCGLTNLDMLKQILEDNNCKIIKTFGNTLYSILRHAYVKAEKNSELSSKISMLSDIAVDIDFEIFSENTLDQIYADQFIIVSQKGV